MAAQFDHRARQPMPEEDLPRITIEQTPVNDLYLLLDVLFPTAQTVRVLRDPAGFVRNHEESLRAAWRLLQHPGDDKAPEGADTTGPQRGRVVRERRASPRTSLLR